MTSGKETNFTHTPDTQGVTDESLEALQTAFDYEQKILAAIVEDIESCRWKGASGEHHFYRGLSPAQDEQRLALRSMSDVEIASLNLRGSLARELRSPDDAIHHRAYRQFIHPILYS